MAPPRREHEVIVVVAVGKAKLRKRLVLGLDWLVDLALKREVELTGERNLTGLRHESYRGAIRGEYKAATREWGFYAPVWHSGQALKALVGATQLPFLADRPALQEKYLAAARLIAQFLLDNQVWARQALGAPDAPDAPNSPDAPDAPGASTALDARDHGLLLAYEETPGLVTVSGVMEATDGLFQLSEVTGDPTFRARAVAALDFVVERCYAGDGIFWDAYDPVARETSNPYAPTRRYNAGKGGRPLQDDSQFLRAYHETGDEKYARVFWEVLACLRADEAPPGNWVAYWPNNPRKGLLHPRHAFWWGRPFVQAARERPARAEEYLAVARRAGDWYVHAIRLDGGIFRDTRTDFATSSLGHAMSGAACAAILWTELRAALDTDAYDQHVKRVLRALMQWQFVAPADPNLAGCVLEKIVLPYDNSDASPYHVRDLGTIFFVQAATSYLKNF